MAVLGGLSKYLRILLTEHFRPLRGTLSLAIMTSEQREVDPRCDAGALTSSQSRLMANHHRHTRRSTLAQSSTLFIGMDVHTETIAVADVVHDHGAEVAYLGTIGTRPCDIAQLVRKLHSTAKHPVLIYDAGPCGSWLSRDLSHKGDDCGVVAPSLIPKTAGDRVKTDRRDAVQLARLARSGDLTAVDGPMGADEAIRDLSRARAEPLSALKAATCRLKAFWRRHDRRYVGRAHWRPAHRRWLAAVVCPTPAPHLVVQAEVRAITEHTARLPRLAQARHDHVKAWRVHPVVEALQALRGGQFIVAVTTVAEIEALKRFDTPRTLMTFLGLLPAESSSGERRQKRMFHGSFGTYR
jgi:transposase